MIAATEADWKLLTDLLEERFGLSFSGARQDILEGRLRPRLATLHLDGVRAYYHYLRAHPGSAQEFEELTTRITNNETYFFREAAHFNAIIEHVVPQLGSPLRVEPWRILCAACSSGEEPYSLAIRLDRCRPGTLRGALADRCLRPQPAQDRTRPPRHLRRAVVPRHR